MGHDIYAFNKSTNKELAYCRISAFDRPKAYLFYSSLNAHEFNGGPSGIGEVKLFKKKELTAALERFKALVAKGMEATIHEAEKDKRTEKLAAYFAEQGATVLGPEYTEEIYAEASAEILEFLIRCQEQDVIIEFR